MMSAHALHAARRSRPSSRRPRPTSRVPVSTLLDADSPIRRLDFLGRLGAALRQVRTSPATTAKPRPCSPARAASTAAFSARMLVWKAMPSMTPMMSAMRLRAVADAPPSSRPPAPPPRRRCAADLRGASRPAALAWRALSAFWRTVRGQLLPSTRRSAAGCAACCSVRWRQVGLPVGDLGRGGGDGIRAGAHARNDLDQRIVHVAQGAHQAAGLVVRAHGDALGQVALGHGAGNFDGFFQRTHDGAHQQRTAHARQQQHAQRAARQLPGQRHALRLGIQPCLLAALHLPGRELVDAGHVGLGGRFVLLLDQLFHRRRITGAGGDADAFVDRVQRAAPGPARGR